MVLRFAILLLSCLGVFSQGFTFQDLPYLSAEPILSATPIPEQIAGLAEWWVATDVTNNTTVTNWIGRIQGIILTNGNSAWQPTNSSSGIWFGHDAVGLTNVPFSLGTNWSVVVFMKKTETLYEATIQSMFGDNLVNGFNAGWYSGSASTVDLGFVANGVNNTFTGGRTPINVERDVGLVISNNTSVAGDPVAFGYTNAVNFGHIAAFRNSVNFACVGESKAWSPNNYAANYIREVLVYTGIVSTLQMSNLHYYRTNTYGAP